MPEVSLAVEGMLFFRKHGRDAVRPLVPLSTEPLPAPDLASLQSTPLYAEALSYFGTYPPRSLMSDDSRAVLYTLIRTRRPTYIAEVGTFYAGTTEVMARACWENNWGIIYTTDPFGADRCPRIIKRWPKDMQKYASFHALGSHDFFLYLDQREISLDFILIDGNHDYEFALFDLQMAARRMRPSGIVVMDNAEQSGPFRATRDFLRLTPSWRELGNTIASHDPSAPFDATRASLPGTSFIILQAPTFIPVSEGPHSWGQIATHASRVTGLKFEVADQAAGTLHYHVVFRAFFKDDSPPVEAKAIGSVRIEGHPPGPLAHSFEEALQLPPDARYTIEIDVSWQADSGSPALALTSRPAPIEG